MNIDSNIKVEKTEILNKLIEDVFHFVEELEQRVRKDLHYLNQGETDDTSTMEVSHSAVELKS
jgi:hypothetical protein